MKEKIINFCKKKTNIIILATALVIVGVGIFLIVNLVNNNTNKANVKAPADATTYLTNQEIDFQITQLRKQLTNGDLTSKERTSITKQIHQLESSK